MEIWWRLRAQLVLEYVGGLRVGETAGCNHGISFNDVTWSPEFIHIDIPHSKTAVFLEDVEILGTSMSGEKYYSVFEELACVTGVSVVDKAEGRSAHYYVCRVPLQSITDKELDLMDQVMRTSSDVEMADTEYRKWLLKRA